MNKIIFFCILAAVTAIGALTHAQSPDFQAIMNGLQTKFDAASDFNWTSSIWSNAVPNPIGSAAWTQVAATFPDMDHTGDGLQDDDQLALLQRILEGEPIAVKVLGKTLADAIKAAFSANLALVSSREAYYDLQILNTSRITMAGPISVINRPIYMSRTRLYTGQGNTVSICVDTGIFIVGHTCLNEIVELPRIWGDTGILSENAPGLGNDIANLFAAYLTIGNQANVDYLQAVIYHLVCRGILPRLSGPIGAKLGNLTSDGLASEDIGGIPSLSIDNAYTSPLLPDINISNTFDPPRRSCMDVYCTSYMDIIRMDSILFGESMQSGIGHYWLNEYALNINGFGPGYPTILDAEGDFNGDGISNVDSYNSAGQDRELWFIAEGPTELFEGEPVVEGETPEQVVTVSNVVTEQQGAFLKVTYDLATSDEQPAYVFGSFSTDGGATFPKWMKTVTGDAGKEVAPGTGRWFVWNFSKDGVSGLIEQARVRVQGGLYPGRERVFGGITFCWIPPGSFLMGRYPGEQDGSISQDPQHEVTFAQGFWMSKYEITQGQWQAIMGSNPASEYGVGDNYPVYYVAWNDIRSTNGYLDKLNTAHPGHGFRLPSEAEWEYACRAGTTTRFYWGDDPGYTVIKDYAWHQDNNTPYGNKPVGGKLPNAWGLHDMSGNVREWCEDDWHGNYNGAPGDGSAWVDAPRSTFRPYRGGSWFVSPYYCRAAYRDHWNLGVRLDDLGFRVVRASD